MIADNYRRVTDNMNEAAVSAGRAPKEITLIAVTKTHSADEINQAIDAGATDIGENRVQEVLEKYDKVKPVRWHLIGHLQTNKVKSIIDKVVMIHSVDSLHLAKEIDKRAKQANLVMDILIEINSAMEESKSGIAAGEVKDLVLEVLSECENVRIRGLMCIPPMAEQPEDSRRYFAEARELFDQMKSWAGSSRGRSVTEPAWSGRLYPDTLSMGMSGDYEVAIEEGATMIRVGSSIFGARNYR